MDKLFSIILLEYNQHEIMYEALDSVLNQTYRNIELIICDDGSRLSKSKVDEYISKKNKGNIKRIKYVLNKKNIGTVATVNAALKLCTGDYILIFAADDAIHNNKVIEKYASLFQLHDNYNIITFQVAMMDSKLNINYGNYVNVAEALELNDKDSIELFKTLSIKCIYGAGATAYRKEIFDKYRLNLEYKLVEDLSFWLYLSLNNEKIYYYNYMGLKHRDGGVSSNKNKISERKVLDYYSDLELLHHKLIIPNLKWFNDSEKLEILKKYENIVYYLKVHNVNINYCKPIYLYIKYPIYFKYKSKTYIKKIIHKFKSLIKKCILIILKILRKIKRTIRKVLTVRFIKYLLWLILNIISFIFIKDTYLFSFIVLLNFYISLIITKYMKKVYKYFRRRHG